MRKDQELVSSRMKEIIWEINTKIQTPILFSEPVKQQDLKEVFMYNSIWQNLVDYIEDNDYYASQYEEAIDEVEKIEDKITEIQKTAKTIAKLLEYVLDYIEQGTPEYITVRDIKEPLSLLNNMADREVAWKTVKEIQKRIKEHEQGSNH